MEQVLGPHVGSAELTWATSCFLFRPIRKRAGSAWQAWFDGGPRVAAHSNDASAKGYDAKVAMLVGSALGAAVRDMLSSVKTSGCFRFLVPLDEALTDLRLNFDSQEVLIDLQPIGQIPSTWPASASAASAARSKQVFQRRLEKKSLKSINLYIYNII